MVRTRCRSSRPTTSGGRFPTSSTPSCAGPSAPPSPGSPPTRPTVRPGSWSGGTCGLGRRARRPPSPTGSQSQGLDVVDLGLASTDLVYFASGRSTRRARCSPPRTTRPVQRHQVLPRRGQGGRAGHRPRPHQGHGPLPGSRRRRPSRASSRASTCSTTSPSTSARSSTCRCCAPLKVVADTANGMGGLVVPAVFDELPFDLEILYGELDGTLPEPPGRPHPAREPGRPAGSGARDRRRCRPRLRRRRRPGVRGRRAGRAASRGRPPPRWSPPASSTSSPAPPILHNLICSKAVPEIIREHGGTPVRTKVGHSLHQGGHGRHRRRVRRRALGALLLPGQLPGRLRAHRRDARPRAALPRRRRRCPSCASRSTATPTRARSTPRSTTRWP